MNKPTTLTISSDEYRDAITWLRGCTLYSGLQSIPRQYEEQFRELGELWFPENTSESGMRAMAFIYSAPDINFIEQRYLWKLKHTEAPMYIDLWKPSTVIFTPNRGEFSVKTKLSTISEMKEALESINMSLDDTVRELPNSTH